ncbi:MAG: hypothetical protein F4129_14610 [Acidimicrobiia bacterium]|nr:hypothetical protein [Acidimicrobiia bacterium]MYB09294.1 hypothetical protein [Acidimicrobiia bacterium]MYH97724.1 hypothetical protein [Acidimicrobiia bacterium]
MEKKALTIIWKRSGARGHCLRPKPRVTLPSLPGLVINNFSVVGERELDIEGFYRWAMGDLVDNRNRGIFAEWLVGQALGAISDDDVRHEWDAYDLLYGKVKVEVKASGHSQTWPQDHPSKPRFDIAKTRRTWEAKTNKWVEHDPPVRFADMYVFCLHEPKKATSENVRDPESWKFWVISRKNLDDELGDQKSVGAGTLDRLVEPVNWSEIKSEVDRLELV